MAREIERRKHGRNASSDSERRTVQRSAASEGERRTVQRSAASEGERRTVQRSASSEAASRDADRRGRGRKKGRKKKGNGVIKFLLLFLLFLAIILGILYAAGSWYFSDHFAYGTVVNNESVFGMTASEVQSILADDLDGYSIGIQERKKDGSSTVESLKGTDIGLQLVFDDTLKKMIRSQAGLGWIITAITGKEIQLDQMVEYDENLWNSAIDSLQCFNSSFYESPQDAYLDTHAESVGVAIVEEVQGNELNRDKAVEVLSAAVLSLQDSVDLDKEGCYKTPAILSTDENLQAEMAKYKKYAEMRITYTFGEKEEVLDGATIISWLVPDEVTGELKVNPTEIENFVATLRRTYDTIYRTHSFDTSYGETVTITEGDYGWWMNYKQEEVELAAMIEAGESGSRTPVYYQTANAYGEHDYGDTYIEANLTAQHLFYYENGELVLESDFVSGKNTDDRRTPEGIYGITYKERFATLKGENYQTPVSYWMPFNGSVGLHDATWRKNFGGSIYDGSGSHGCLNLPCKTAKELYSHVKAGTPVIVYSLDGTRSRKTSSQSTSDIAQTCIDAFDAIPNVSAEKKEEVLKWMRTFYNEIGGAARKKVTNYSILKEAEAALKAGG